MNDDSPTEPRRELAPAAQQAEHRFQELQQGVRVRRRARRFDSKSQWSNWTVLAMLALCAFALIEFRPLAIFARQSAGAIGQRLAQLDLAPLSGQGRTVTLDDLTGRVVLLDFWEPQAAADRGGLPHIAGVADKFRGQPALRVLPVACGRAGADNVASLRAHTQATLRNNNLQLAAYSDPRGLSREAVGRVVGDRRIPATLAIDRRGRIRGVWLGQPTEQTRQEVEQLVAQLLREE